MASIVKRNNSYCVVYTYKHTNGTQKQKWETFTDLADAKNRKKEVEYKESVGTFVAPQCRTLKDLLKEYVTLYGRTKWALSTYQSNTALISNYIEIRRYLCGTPVPNSKRFAYRICCPVRKNQMGTLNLSIKQCSDFKLHNTAYRLNEAARSHHPRN